MQQDMTQRLMRAFEAERNTNNMLSDQIDNERAKVERLATELNSQHSLLQKERAQGAKLVSEINAMRLRAPTYEDVGVRNSAKEDYSHNTHNTHNKSRHLLLASSDQEGDEMHAMVKETIMKALRTDSKLPTKFLHVGDFATIGPGLRLLKMIGNYVPNSSGVEKHFMLGNRDLNHWRLLIVLNAPKLFGPEWPKRLFKAMTWLVADVGDQINPNIVCPKYEAALSDASLIHKAWMQTYYLLERAIVIAEGAARSTLDAGSPLHAFFYICTTNMMGGTSSTLYDAVTYKNDTSTIMQIAKGEMKTGDYWYDRLATDEVAELKRQWGDIKTAYDAIKPNPKALDAPKDVEIVQLLNTLASSPAGVARYIKHWSYLGSLYEKVFEHTSTCLMYQDEDCASVHAGLVVPFVPANMINTARVDSQTLAPYGHRVGLDTNAARVNKAYHELVNTTKSAKHGANNLDACTAYITLAALSGVPVKAINPVTGAPTIVDSNGLCGGKQFLPSKNTPDSIEKANAATDSTRISPTPFLFTGHQPALLGEIIRWDDPLMRQGPKFNMRLDTQYAFHHSNVIVAAHGLEKDEKLKRLAREHRQLPIDKHEVELQIKQAWESYKQEKKLAIGDASVEYQVKGIVQDTDQRKSFRVVVFRWTEINFQALGVPIIKGQALDQVFEADDKPRPVVFNALCCAVHDISTFLNIQMPTSRSFPPALEGFHTSKEGAMLQSEFQNKISAAIHQWLRDDTSRPCGVLREDTILKNAGQTECDFTKKTLPYHTLVMASPLRDQLVGLRGRF